MKKVEHLDIANHSEYIVIKEAAEQIENAYDPEKAIHTILSLISRQMGLNRGRILLQDGDSGYLHTAYSYGLTEEEISRSRFAMSEGISGKVMYTGTPTIVSDIDKEDDYLFRTVDRSTLPEGKVSFIATPITRNNTVIGVFAVNRLANPRRSLDKDLGLLKLISLFVSEILAVHAMLERQTHRLKEENEQLRSMALGQGSQYGIIGESSALMAALNKVGRATNTSVTVMLQGESGTGKERFSRMLHLASHRKDGPFIAINCSAIPEELLESELFGHEKGAFTGAVTDKIGHFEAADGGVLFLDEVGNLNHSTQVQLLRALQERKVKHVGSNREVSVDVRILAATNEDLNESKQIGAFREDLYHRLNEFQINVPPLRERKSDIMHFAEFFLNMANDNLGKSVVGFDKSVEYVFTNYAWPGNLREMKNTVQRATLLTKRELITLNELPPSFYENTQEYLNPLFESEGERIKRVLNISDYNKSKAARLLNMDRKTLYRKIKIYKL